MRCDLRRPEMPHQDHHAREASELEQHLPTDGEPEQGRARQRPQAQIASRPMRQRAPQKRPSGSEYAERHHSARDRRGPSGAVRAEGGKAKVARYQKVVDDYVQDVGGNDGHDDRAESMRRLQRLAEHREGIEPDGPRDRAHHVIVGSGCQLGRLAHPEQRGLARELDADGEDGHAERDHQPASKRASENFGITRPVGLREERADGKQHSQPEDHRAPTPEAAEPDGCECLRGDVSDERGVHDPHHHHAELHGDHRRRETQRGMDVRAGGGEGADGVVDGARRGHAVTSRCPR